MQRDIWSYGDDTVGDVDLTGYTVEATDGDIGKVDEASYDVGSGHVVVDTGAWIFGKKVLLPAGVIDRIESADERIFVSRTKDEIKNSPEYDPERGIDDDYRGDLGAYYGQPTPVETRRTDPPL